LELMLEMSMRDEAFVGKSQEEIDCHSICPLWYSNLIRQDKYETWNQKSSLDSDTVRCRIKFEGMFAEKFELRNFPFDNQELHVRISTKLPSSQLKLLPRTDSPNHVKTDPTIAFTFSEWRLHAHVDTSVSDTITTESAMGKTYPMLVFSVHVTREWGYYFWNVFLILFFLVTMSGAAFSMPADQPSNRLSVVITLVLTAVAFKSSISQNIPKISYNTFVDTYSFYCTCFLGLVVLENSVVPYINAENADSIFIAVVVVMWGMFNLITCFRAYLFVRRNWHVMHEADRIFLKEKADIVAAAQKQAEA